MKRLTVLACLGIWLFSSAAFAGPQQERMKSCSKEAKEKALAGSERKAFMKACLSGKEPAVSDRKAAVNGKK